MNVLETARLTKRYGRTTALADCTIAIPAGHIVALVGPNGAGKTTLLHLATGILRPTSGRIEVLGAPIGRHRDRVGFVAQDAALYAGLPVADLLRLAGSLNRRWDAGLAGDRIAGLGIPAGRPFGKLSGGQQSQVALALAVAKRPDLLLLDEPLARLDPLARHEFLGTLMAAVAEFEISVVFSSHVIAELERFCDYLVVIRSGAVQVADKVDDLLADHRRLSGPAATADQVAAGAVVLAALVVGLLVTGLKIRSAYTGIGLDTCGRHCTAQQYVTFTAQANTWGLWTQYLALLPGLLGMFVGAPLIAREYETGTFRFAFTQGITPLRLIVTKLLLLGGALVALTLAFSALFHWWYTPIADTVKDRLGPWAYQADGIYLAAGTLFSFAFGVLVGAVIRRTVPAMLATLVFWAITFAVDWKVLRPTFEPPIVAPTSVFAGAPARPWIVDSWYVDASGHRLSTAQWNALVATGHSDGNVGWASFEPGDRFWHFQRLDAAWLVTAAVLFALAALWWLRRRPT